MPEYVARFKCPNCAVIFTKNIPEGQTAQGNAGYCPNCKCNRDTVVRGTGQKLGSFEVVPPDSAKPDGSKIEILMEEDGIKIKTL